MTRRARWRSTCVAAVAAAFASSHVACSSGGEAPPTRLMDGSPARTSRIAFEGVDLPVLVTLAQRVSEEPSCADGDAQDVVLVERIGVTGASVTSYSARTRALYACDRVASIWCGHAFARIQRGRPLDPRLSLTCEDTDGDPVGFVSIEPGAAARYVVVSHDAYAEAYRAMDGVPVRVTTNDVDVTTSTARLDVSEHAVDGRRLGEYRLDAQVAG